MRKLQGQTVSGMIVPHTTKDEYPTHSSEYGKGGHKEVITLQDRDDIPEERLIDGTICYVKETDKEYQYKNKKWVEYSSLNKEVIIQESNKLQQEIDKLKNSKQDKGDYVVNATLNQYAKKSDIPDHSQFAKKSDIPDTSNFARKSDIPASQDLSNYAKKSDIPDVSQFAKKSDIPQGQDLSKYATKDYVDSKTFSGGGTNYEVTDFSVTGNKLRIKQNNGIDTSVTLPTGGGSNVPGRDGIDGDGIEQVYLNSNTSSLQGSILDYTFGYVNGDHDTQRISREYASTTDNYVPEQCTNYIIKPTVDLQYLYVSQRKKVFAEGSTTKKVWGEFEPLRLLYVYTKAEIDPSLVEKAIKSALEESAKLDEIIRQKLLDQFGIDKEALQKALQQIKDGQTELNNVQAEINKLKGKVDVNASSIDTLTNTVKNVGINLDAVKAQLTQYVTSSDIDDKVAKAVRTTLDGLEPSWTTIVAELWPDKDLSKASQIKINSDNISALTERTTQTEHDVAALKLSTGDKSAAAELVAAVSDKKTGKVTAASIIAAVNNSSSEVTLKADKIQLDGKTIAKEIQAEDLELKGHVKATNAEIIGRIESGEKATGKIVIEDGKIKFYPPTTSSCASATSFYLGIDPKTCMPTWLQDSVSQKVLSRTVYTIDPHGLNPTQHTVYYSSNNPTKYYTNSELTMPITESYYSLSTLYHNGVIELNHINNYKAALSFLSYYELLQIDNQNLVNTNKYLILGHTYTQMPSSDRIQMSKSYSVYYPASRYVSKDDIGVIGYKDTIDDYTGNIESVDKVLEVTTEFKLVSKGSGHWYTDGSSMGELIQF